MTRHYSNTAQPTTLTADCTDSATTIQVGATTGFPAVEFILALDYETASQELVLVTSIAGTTLTVTRGHDGTTATAHSTGAAVRHVHAAVDFSLSRDHEAGTARHGATGAVVGTTNVQTLTNKDLSSGTNSFPATLATTTSLSAHTGATAAHGASGAVVGTTNTQTLTNKDLSSGTNTFPASLATDAELSTHAGLTVTHGATGAVVGTTNTQTLTNKTLTAPNVNAPVIKDANNLYRDTFMWDNGATPRGALSDQVRVDSTYRRLQIVGVDPAKPIGNPVVFRGQHTAATSISDSVAAGTAIDWSDDYDPDGMHSGTASSITAQTDSTFKIEAKATLVATSTTGYFEIQIYKNSVADKTIARTACYNGTLILSGFGTVAANSGDILEVRIRHTNGGTRAMSSTFKSEVIVTDLNG